MRTLYQPIEPYDQGRLTVSSLHNLYYEQAGNPHGNPVVFLHGGPGAGIEPVHRQYFDPKQWRIVLFDQRGCGQSTPHAELRENTTWDLVADIERLREHLGIERWMVFGGSWGSTLALAYSQTHPERCTSIILRGIFLLRRKELHWFYQEGASYIFPDAWEDYIAPIPPDERFDLLSAYHKRLTSSDEQARLEAAQAWSRWEAATITLYPNPKLVNHFTTPIFAEAFARIENHYFVNSGFFDSDDQLLRNVNLIQHIPALIVQGRYDMVCPMLSAWDLHRAWPEAKFVLVDGAGHAVTEPGIGSVLLDATDHFAKIGLT